MATHLCGDGAVRREPREEEAEEVEPVLDELVAHDAVHEGAKGLQQRAGAPALLQQARRVARKRGRRGACVAPQRRRRQRGGRGGVGAHELLQPLPLLHRVLSPHLHACAAWAPSVEGCEREKVLLAAHLLQHPEEVCGSDARQILAFWKQNVPLVVLDQREWLAHCLEDVRQWVGCHSRVVHARVEGRPRLKVIPVLLPALKASA